MGSYEIDLIIYNKKGEFGAFNNDALRRDLVGDDDLRTYLKHPGKAIAIFLNQ